MTDRQGKIRLLLSLLILLLCVAGSYCIYRYIKHETLQNKKIQDLSEYVSKLENNLENQNQQIEELTNQLDELQHSSVTWLDQGINYFAIGNSITSHPIADYWWNDGVGMAASCEENDYVHQISKWLEDNYNESVETKAYNFYTWEVQSNDRAETLQLLDKYLSDELDLITIQLSENVSNVSTFQEDFEELCRYIIQKSPSAQIIVIDDFWDSGEKSSMKENAARSCNVDFVSLDEIKGNADYQAGLGSIVYDQNGNGHVIEHEGVAVHPGNKGMKYIAEAVEKKIEVN